MASEKYPDDSVQSWTNEWWVRDDKLTPVRGRLLWTFVPFPEQKPHRLFPESRTSDPTDHTRALVRIEPFRMGQAASGGGAPVPALPLYPGESYFVVRGKVRPALILSEEGPLVPKALRGSATHQTSPTLLVAPYYGADKDGTRAGWNPALLERFRRAEYPQYMWDRLPLPGAHESILRLDHIFPLSIDPAAYELTPYRLSAEAVAILNEWLHWRTMGSFPADSILAEIRSSLLS